VHVLGTGEAFDGSVPHTSLLLLTARTRLLLDCGSFVPPTVWSELPPDRGLQGVWVSHLHADHVMGMPLLLGRMWEEGRTEPLAVLGARGIMERVLAFFELGYPGLLGQLRFRVEEIVVEPSRPVAWRDLGLESAESHHGLRNLAVRIEAGGEALTYSGDGAPTPASAALASGAHWIHECFAAEQAPQGHADLATLAVEVRKHRPKRLGLVHVGRRNRAAVRERAVMLAEEGLPIEILEPGASWRL
jgi:ribonuclease BN (tRNA processing enzyme)